MLYGPKQGIKLSKGVCKPDPNTPINDVNMRNPLQLLLSAKEFSNLRYVRNDVSNVPYVDPHNIYCREGVDRSMVERMFYTLPREPREFSEPREFRGPVVIHKPEFFVHSDTSDYISEPSEPRERMWY